MEKKVEVVLVSFKTCKHSVRYDSCKLDIGKLASIYVGNEALVVLGNPKKIKVTIEPVD